MLCFYKYYLLYYVYICMTEVRLYIWRTKLCCVASFFPIYHQMHTHLKGFWPISEVPTSWHFSQDKKRPDETHVRFKVFFFVKSVFFFSFYFFKMKCAHTQLHSSWCQLGGTSPHYSSLMNKTLPVLENYNSFKSIPHLYCQSDHTKFFHFMALFWCTLATAQVRPAAPWMANCLPLELL